MIPARTAIPALLLLLTLAACQPVDINPEAVRSAPDTARVDPTPAPTAPAAPNGFYLPSHMTLSNGDVTRTNCAATTYQRRSGTQLLGSLQVRCYIVTSRLTRAQIDAELAALVLRVINEQGYGEPDAFVENFIDNYVSYTRVALVDRTIPYLGVRNETR